MGKKKKPARHQTTNAPVQKTEKAPAPTSEKVLFIIRITLSAAIIILALLQLFKVWDRSIDVLVPLTALLIITVGLERWKANRTAAFVCFAAAAILLGFAVAVFFMK